MWRPVELLKQAQVAAATCSKVQRMAHRLLAAVAAA